MAGCSRRLKLAQHKLTNKPTESHLSTVLKFWSAQQSLQAETASWPDTAFRGFLFIVLSISYIKNPSEKNDLKYWPLKDTAIPWSNRALQSELFLRWRASLKRILEKVNPDLLCLKSPCGRELKGLVPECWFIGCVKRADGQRETGGCPQVLGSCWRGKISMAAKTGNPSLAYEMIRWKCGLPHQLCMLTLLSGSISVKISFLE